MKVLWVYAHPEPRSLNGSLKNSGLQALAKAGHETQLSDLYAMKWNPAASADDFPQRDRSERLEYMSASRKVYDTGTLAPEIAAEQKKLFWCDTLILQFPFWWFSMPAILKGWVDRVFSEGLAYGHIDEKWPGRPGRSVRYGHGVLEGRRAMLVVTASGADAMSARGIGGDIQELLFPINHGMLWYAGFTVMPSFLVHGMRKVPPERFAEITQSLEKRLLEIPTAAPIPYRKQNGGDYDDKYILKDGLSDGVHGFRIHQTQAK